MFQAYLKQLLLIGAFLVSPFLAASIAQAETVQDSEDPVELVVYSGRKESLIGPALAKYTAATGNPVKVKYGSTSGMTALLLEEGDATPADVFIAQDAGALGALAKKKRLQTLPESMIVTVEPRLCPPKHWLFVLCKLCST